MRTGSVEWAIFAAMVRDSQGWFFLSLGSAIISTAFAFAVASAAHTFGAHGFIPSDTLRVALGNVGVPYNLFSAIHTRAGALPGLVGSTPARVSGVDLRLIGLDLNIGLQPAGLALSRAGFAVSDWAMTLREGEAALDQRLASSLTLQEGDRFLVGLGERVYQLTYVATIRWVAATAMESSGSGTVLVNSSTLDRLSGGYLEELYVPVERVPLALLQTQISGRAVASVREHRGLEGNVLSPAVAGSIWLLALFVAGSVAICVAALSIALTRFRPQLAALRAIGADSRQLSGLVDRYGVTVSLVATLGGLLAGLGMHAWGSLSPSVLTGPVEARTFVAPSGLSTFLSVPIIATIVGGVPASILRLRLLGALPALSNAPTSSLTLHGLLLVTSLVLGTICWLAGAGPALGPPLLLAALSVVFVATLRVAFTPAVRAIRSIYPSESLRALVGSLTPLEGLPSNALTISIVAILSAQTAALAIIEGLDTATDASLATRYPHALSAAENLTVGAPYAAASHLASDGRQHLRDSFWGPRFEIRVATISLNGVQAVLHAYRHPEVSAGGRIADAGNKVSGSHSGSRGGVALSTTLARRAGYSVGSWIQIPTEAGMTTVRVVDIVSDPIGPASVVYLHPDLFDSFWPQRSAVLSAGGLAEFSAPTDPRSRGSRAATVPTERNHDPVKSRFLPAVTSHTWTLPMSTGVLASVLFFAVLSLALGRASDQQQNLRQLGAPGATLSSAVTIEAHLLGVAVLVGGFLIGGVVAHVSSAAILELLGWSVDIGPPRALALRALLPTLVGMGISLIVVSYRTRHRPVTRCSPSR